MSAGAASCPDSTAFAKCFNCAEVGGNRDHTGGVATADAAGDAADNGATLGNTADVDVDVDASTSRCDMFKQVPAGTTMGAKAAAPVCFAIALQLATTGEIASGYADSAAHANEVVICPTSVPATYPRWDGRIGVQALNALLNVGASASFKATNPARTLSEQPGTCVS